MNGDFVFRKTNGGKEYVFYLCGDESAYAYIRILSTVFSEINASEFYVDFLLRTGDGDGRILRCSRIGDTPRYKIHQAAPDADIDKIALEILKEKPKALRMAPITEYELAMIEDRVKSAAEKRVTNDDRRER